MVCESYSVASEATKVLTTCSLASVFCASVDLFVFTLTFHWLILINHSDWLL